jgi:hypothetical protein
MDLNLIYNRYSISLYWADHALCSEIRAVHRALADGFASKIATAKLEGSVATC